MRLFVECWGCKKLIKMMHFFFTTSYCFLYQMTRLIIDLENKTHLKLKQLSFFNFVNLFLLNVLLVTSYIVNKL